MYKNQIFISYFVTWKIFRFHNSELIEKEKHETLTHKQNTTNYHHHHQPLLTATTLMNHQAKKHHK